MALAGEREGALDLLLVDRVAVAGVVLADHREQIAEQLALARGQVTGDRVDGSDRRPSRACPPGARRRRESDPTAPSRVDRGAVGVGRSARQGSALRLCRYFLPLLVGLAIGAIGARPLQCGPLRGYDAQQAGIVRLRPGHDPELAEDPRPPAPPPRGMRPYRAAPTSSARRASSPTAPGPQAAVDLSQRASELPFRVPAELGELGRRRPSRDVHNRRRSRSARPGRDRAPLGGSTRTRCWKPWAAAGAAARVLQSVTTRLRSASAARASSSPPGQRRQTHAGRSAPPIAPRLGQAGSPPGVGGDHHHPLAAREQLGDSRPAGATARVEDPAVRPRRAGSRGHRGNGAIGGIAAELLRVAPPPMIGVTFGAASGRRDRPRLRRAIGGRRHPRSTTRGSTAPFQWLTSSRTAMSWRWSLRRLELAVGAEGDPAGASASRVLSLKRACLPSSPSAARRRRGPRGPAAAPRGCPCRTAPASRAARQRRGRATRRRRTRRSAPARRLPPPARAERAWAAKASRKASSPRRRQLDPGGRLVAAEAAEVLGAGIEAGEQVEARDAAARSLRRPVVVDREHDRRPVVALDQPRGDDPDDARMPPLAGDHDHGRRRAARRAGPRRAASAALPTSRSVSRRSGLARVELGGDRRRPRRVLGQHQLDPGVGAVEAPGGVDPRRQPEGEVALVEPLRLHPRDRHQRPQARAACAPNLRQPAPHQEPVLADQRHQVGDRRQRDEVEVADPARLVAGRSRAPAPRRASRPPPAPQRLSNG